MGSKVVANALREQGFPVELLEDRFANDAADEEWLPKIGELGWLILTKDDKIRRRPVERDALLRSGARAFVLPSGNMSGQEMASTVVKALPKIQRFVNKNQPPFIARISKAGDVRKIELKR